MGDVDRRAARAVWFALVGAAVLRTLAALVYGFTTIANAPPGVPFESARVGQVLVAFGSYADTLTALLVLAALGVMVWDRRRTETSGSESASFLLQLLFFLTAAGAIVRVAGEAVEIHDFGGPSAWSAFAPHAIAAAGDVLLCVIGAGAVRWLNGSAVDDADTDEGLLFAVDRADGEVFAFFSSGEAARTLSPYSVDEDEFTFYSDIGNVIAATVVNGRTTFIETDVNRRDELLAHLRSFATVQDLPVDPLDSDDPTAYAMPISEWQALELWPPWLRWLGRLLRRARGL